MKVHIDDQSTMTIHYISYIYCKCSIVNNIIFTSLFLILIELYLPDP